ncbi:MAG: phoP [Burkholderiaceae bacterium]|nr:phoP [Burkholderiaceae bacterium]
MTRIKIAALDDNPTHLQMVEQALVGDAINWSVPVEFKGFSSGEALLRELKEMDYDCVVLDRAVPDMSGDVILNWLRQYRPNRTGVVMLTSSDAQRDVVESLKAGADEYLTKPFFPAELLVRVKKLVERIKVQQEIQKNILHDIASDAVDSTHHLHDAIFNDFDLTVNHCEQLVKLTEREYQLAKFFFNNVGLNVSRKAILDAIWFQDNLESTRSLTTHIHNIRIKLDLTIENGWILRPVYGFGYRLDRLSGE